MILFDYGFSEKELLKEEDVYSITGLRPDTSVEKFIIRKLINDICIINMDRTCMYAIPKEAISINCDNKIIDCLFDTCYDKIIEAGTITTESGNIRPKLSLSFPIQYYYNMHIDNGGFVEERVGEFRIDSNGNRMFLIWHPKALDEFKCNVEYK